MLVSSFGPSHRSNMFQRPIASTVQHSVDKPLTPEVPNGANGTAAAPLLRWAVANVACISQVHCTNTVRFCSTACSPPSPFFFEQGDGLFIDGLASLCQQAAKCTRNSSHNGWHFLASVPAIPPLTATPGGPIHLQIRTVPQLLALTSPCRQVLLLCY
jgi:hypothetical protein